MATALAIVGMTTNWQVIERTVDGSVTDRIHHSLWGACYEIPARHLSKDDFADCVSAQHTHQPRADRGLQVVDEGHRMLYHYYDSPLFNKLNQMYDGDGGHQMQSSGNNTTNMIGRFLNEAVPTAAPNDYDYDNTTASGTTGATVAPTNSPTATPTHGCTDIPGSRICVSRFRLAIEACDAGNVTMIDCAKPVARAATAVVFGCLTAVLYGMAMVCVLCFDPGLRALTAIVSTTFCTSTITYAVVLCSDKDGQRDGRCLFRYATDNCTLDGQSCKFEAHPGPAFICIVAASVLSLYGVYVVLESALNTKQSRPRTATRASVAPAPTRNSTPHF
jgi:hypothetical protein